MTPSIPYTKIGQEDGSESLTVFAPGGAITVNDDHPQYAEVLAAAQAGDGQRARELADLSITVAGKFKNLSDRVSVASGRVYFDGDELHNAIAKHILSHLEAGTENWKPLVLFMENLAANPQPHSRNQLYDWLDRRDFTITRDGHFYAYKGVTQERTSIQQGPATVDGVPLNGRIPNRDGSIITMPRGDVAHDPSVGCHTGLHVGSWEYASCFGRRTLLVKVNPRDVVSVPTDCDWAKVRTCRYEVVGEVEAAEGGPLAAFDPDDLVPNDATCA